MKRLIYYKNGKSYGIFIGIVKRFQGIGFIISFDNPITLIEYFKIEIIFLWFKFWIVKNLNRTKCRNCGENVKMISTGEMCPKCGY